MTASEEWLRQQPAKDRGEPQVEAQPGEGTPHSHQAPSRASNLGKSHELSTSPPSSPRASAALSGGGGGSTAAASPPPGAAAAAAATGLLLQKHLAFPDWQAEATFRLFNARCCCLSELGLVGLQLVGWMAAAGRAVEIRSWRIVARVSLLVLAPTLAQLWLILYAPYTYRSHRQWLSMATRAPFDAWLVFTQDASVLGFGGALISRGMPHQAKLLMVMFFEFVMSPLLVGLPFLFTYVYNSSLLVLWVHFHLCGAAAGGLMTAALLAAYCLPLAAMYHREAGERTAYAMRLLEQADSSGIAVDVARQAQRVRARVDADLLAPLDLLLLAAVGACCASCV